MTTYIVEKPDGTTEPVKAQSITVEDGHLIARRYDCDPSSATAAWAPGAWVRVREAPTNEWIDHRQRGLRTLELAMSSLVDATRDVSTDPEMSRWIQEQIVISRAWLAATQSEAA